MKTDTPLTDTLIASLPSTMDTPGDAEVAKKLIDHARAMEKKATQRREIIQQIIEARE